MKGDSLKRSMNMSKIFQDMAILAVLDLFLVDGEALAQWRDYGWQMGWGMMGWFAPVMMVVFWVAVIVAIVFLVRWLAASGGAASRTSRSEDSALEILKKRYARGEINKEEFEEKKKDLI
jgi:putative membrane protein